MKLTIRVRIRIIVTKSGVCINYTSGVGLGLGVNPEVFNNNDLFRC